MNSGGGYVRAYRKALTHSAFRNEGEAMAFLWLVARAAWKPVSISYRKHSVSLERGQLVISQRDMAERLDRDKSWVERFMARLEDNGMIVRQQRGTTQGSSEAASKTAPTIVTICNYDIYQPIEGEGEAATDLQPRQQRGTTQGSQENKELKKGRSKSDPPPIVPPLLGGLDDGGLPDWLPVAEWKGWLEMRRMKRAAASPRAQTLAIKKLDGMRKRGLDPAKVLDLATMRSWTDIYEPRDSDEATVKRRLTV